MHFYCMLSRESTEKLLANTARECQRTDIIYEANQCLILFGSHVVVGCFLIMPSCNSAWLPILKISLYNNSIFNVAYLFQTVDVNILNIFDLIEKYNNI